MKRITCRKLAEELGVSVMTVSRALRNHPSLPLKTRQRVQALAAERGYRPDPALSALNAYRHASKTVKYQATLAWINTFPNQAVFHAGELGAYFQGVRHRANELGYSLEEFRVLAREDWKRLARTCKARGIEGIVVPLRPAFEDVEDRRIFPWEDFCAVAVAESTAPALHLVVNNQFQSAALAVRQLHALGYRKIGLIMSSIFAANTDFLFVGGYQSECLRLDLRPLILLDVSAGAESQKKHTAQWLDQHRPEAVIAPGDGDIIPALQEAEMRVPEDIAVAFLARFPGYPEFAGIDQNGRQIGVTAADLLIDLIRRNERGIPASPMRLLIEGTWISGSSAPRKGDSRGAAR